MAYQTTSTTSFISSSTPITGYPFTLAVVGKWSLLTGVAIPINVGGSGNFVRLFFDGAGAGDPLVFTAADPTFRNANSTTAYSNIDWNYAVGVGTATNSRTVYLNGGSNATSTVNVIPSGWNAVTLADTANTGTGQTAEAAVWDVALTLGEVQSLAKGFKPYRIRPQSLVYYAPLVRDLIETVGGLTLTNNGTTVVAHPRVY